ncbi:hypothetical protein CC85DRAFT_29652 [Cutaneotrichosporon oleaginosum]|uniref:Uncharacterized protein n=1 Tax=Cutaneotrichosporon oleaginosum TaxID=879819 RepID=A0A0J0XSN3_9TREE|nr:uncharacterized protein CC85DRAFT_29652 [Cutaneotrichosporon oleaginosum]KLT44065.1 hypothetical protein CC85DRAFT_29652 [Cutaneotrichosporon oleaginosum]
MATIMGQAHVGQEAPRLHLYCSIHRHHIELARPRASESGGAPHLSTTRLIVTQSTRGARDVEGVLCPATSHAAEPPAAAWLRRSSLGVQGHLRCWTRCAIVRRGRGRAGGEASPEARTRPRAGGGGGRVGEALVRRRCVAAWIRPPPPPVSSAARPPSSARASSSSSSTTTPCSSMATEPPSVSSKRAAGPKDLVQDIDRAGDESPPDQIVPYVL